MGSASAYTVTYTDRFNRSQGEKPVKDLTPNMIEKINHLATLRQQQDPSASQEDLDQASYEVAYDLIDMLFRGDFSGDGKHWSFDGHSANRLASETPNVESFEVSESYCWDWKDIYAVAESKGTIIIDHDKKTILVKEYSFYCSG